jgi:hypothetical protein
MRGLKTLISTTVLLGGFALAPAARAQVVISIGMQPVCSYGYYDYAPYACAPMGFYGSGYFYNGIFLGMGPWAGWGYGHGWGAHRFVNGGGGHYNGRGGELAARGYERGGPEIRGGGGPGRQAYAGGSHNQPHAVAPSRGPGNTGAAHSNVTHSAPRAASPHSGGGGGHAGAQPHGGGGGEPHGGGDSHGGGGKH